MKIKTVAVLGAGAVGSYVIWGLSRRKDIRLGVRSETLAAGGAPLHPAEGTCGEIEKRLHDQW